MGVMTDEELDPLIEQLWERLPIPVDDLPEAGLLPPAAILIENGMARVQDGVLREVSLEEQLGQIFGWLVERHLRRAMATGETAATDVDVTE